MHARTLAFSLAFLLVTAVPGLASAGSVLGNSDTDSLDDTMDNCRDVSNPSQTDTDLDGCGNACDADYDNDGVVGASDFNRLRSCFGLFATATTINGPCATVDRNDDGKIGSTEFSGGLRAGFGKKPGPSLSPLRKPALCRAF